MSAPDSFDPEDVLLLVLEANERVLGKSRLNGITRLEKLIFLLSKETGATGVSDKFTFRPHNFGPFSSVVYDAKDFLSGIGLLHEETQPLPSYYAGAAEKAIQDLVDDDTEDAAAPDSVAHERVFELTPLGRTAAGNLRSQFGVAWPELVDGVDRVVGKYGDQPLNQIIRYVYNRYPDTTSQSIHPEARRMRTGAA
jgi:uncharacterized protein